ncbi:MAG: hypothetical protein Q7K44_05325 [Candidatus Liptonbacteria bacterium]|nr:hypothetical protein [Candidatus Liptonbacteria bacterium]
MKKPASVFLLLAICFVCSAQEKQEKFNVGGTPSNAAAVTQILGKVYHELPENQKVLIGNGLYFHAQCEEPFASIGGAYGPEDDPDYKYPDKNLYPTGTIKVNICPYSMDLFSIANKTDDPVTAFVFEKLSLELFVHEIKHVEQYRENPVVALSKEDDCGKKYATICDPDKLEGTKTKMYYELAALRLGHELGPNKITAEQWTHAQAWLANHKELITPRIAGIEKMTHEQLQRTDIGELFYSAIYVPIILAQQCKSGGKLNEMQIQYGFNVFELEDQSENSLTKGYPYLKNVFKELAPCLIVERESNKIPSQTT